MDDTETTTVFPTEDPSVRYWRHEQYMRMGFTPWMSALLIEWNVDWHTAEELMSAGCKPFHALTILAPLSL